MVILSPQRISRPKHDSLSHLTLQSDRRQFGLPQRGSALSVAMVALDSPPVRAYAGLAS